LIVDAHTRPADERHVVEDVGIEAQFHRELRLVVKRLRLGAVGAATRCVQISADPFEVARDVVLANDRVDFGDELEFLLFLLERKP
jgi:hypothetical protein